MRKWLLLLALLFVAPNCWATGWVFVTNSGAGNAQTSGATLTVTLGANDATGDTVYCAAYDQSGINIAITLSDGNSNNYHKDVTVNLATDQDTFAVFHADNIAVGTQNPVQVTGHGTFIALIVCGAFSGGKASSLDQAPAGNNATNTSLTSNNATPSVSNELIIGGVGMSYSIGGTPTLTVGSGFTQIKQENKSGASTPVVGLEYQIVSGTSALAATWTYSVSGEYAATITTYEPATASTSANMPAVVY